MVIYNIRGYWAYSNKDISYSEIPLLRQISNAILYDAVKMLIVNTARCPNTGISMNPTNPKVITQISAIAAIAPIIQSNRCNISLIN